MKAWDWYWYGNVAAVRPYLVAKIFPVVLALDVLMTRLGSGAQYHPNEFNIAHFEWLDVVQPAPRAATYIGALILAAWFALISVIAPIGRFASGAVLVLYTYAWAMSRLDGYQHHYMLSLVLLCVILFPHINAADLIRPTNGSRRKRASHFHRWFRNSAVTSAWGYVLLAALIAVVYTYTSIAKMDSQWRSGVILTIMRSAVNLFRPIENVFSSLGMSHDAFWTMVATSTIVVELVIALGYVLSVCQDRMTGRWVRWICWVSCVLALGLHFSFELIGLRIGWFSSYMILLACVYFLPASWLQLVAELLSWPVRRFSMWTSSRAEVTSREKGAVFWVTAAVLVASFMTAVGYNIDLPGSLGVMLVAGIGLVVVVSFSVLRRMQTELSRYLLAAFLGAMVVWIAVVNSNCRCRFYSYLCNELYRQNRVADANVAVSKAERYLQVSDTMSLNNIAWYLAVHNDPQVRAPHRAVRYAKRACELTKYGRPSHLGTLAASYASSGQYGKAVSLAERALGMTGNPHGNLATRVRKQLQFYKNGSAFIESPPVDPYDR